MLGVILGSREQFTVGEIPGRGKFCEMQIHAAIIRRKLPAANYFVANLPIFIGLSLSFFPMFDHNAPILQTQGQIVPGCILFR